MEIINLQKLTGVNQKETKYGKTRDNYKINFNPQSGHEQAGYRPAVVISNDIFNEKARLSIVCPITNTNNDFPLHVPLDTRTKTTGVILCEHIKAFRLK